MRFAKATLIYFLIFAFCFPALAAQQKDPLAGLTPSQEAGMRLLAMQSKGLIELSIGEPSTFMLVEPLGWKGLKHVEKKNLVRLALLFCQGLNQEGKNIDFVIVQDMTSRDTLARAYVKENRFEISK